MALDLNSLNFKDIGNWPAGPKVGLLFVLLVLIVAGGWYFDWSDQMAQVESERQKEIALRDKFVQKKRQAINLEAYRKQLADIEQALGAMLKQLPNKSEMEALLTDINQAGLGRGLQFELFRPAPQENVAEFYAELPITLKVTGQYHDIGAFASDVSQLPRIVTLNDLALSVDKSGTLVLDATARTYRYLDDAELAEQRKTAKGKGPKK
jgi:type IV pilus assembly protein PilO